MHICVVLTINIMTNILKNIKVMKYTKLKMLFIDVNQELITNVIYIIIK